MMRRFSTIDVGNWDTTLIKNKVTLNISIVR